MKPELFEVWGDTVDGRHLVYAIGIGALVSLGAFFLAQYVLVGWVESLQMARAYAMLVGIVGCLAGGAISAVLFKPKRHVVELLADPAWRARILIELQNEYGPLGSLADLPPATIAELRELDLYDLFADYEKGLPACAESANAPAAAAAAGTVSIKGGRP
jgi:multidrug transporter EmrE-like cation transporter